MKVRNVFALMLLAAVAVALFTMGCLANSGPNASPTPSGNLSEKQTNLLSFSSWDDVSSFLTASQANAGYGAYGGYRGGMMEKALANGAPQAQGAEDQGSGSVSSSQDYSTTNNQVQGVDEPDIVKNDGSYLYVVSENKVKIVKAYPASDLNIVSQISMENDSYVTDIFVYKDKLVVLGNKQPPFRPGVLGDLPMPVEADGGIGSTGSAGGVAVDAKIAAPASGMPICLGCYGGGQASFAYVYDISDRSNPKLVKSFVASGSYLQSRLIGGRVFIISTEYAYVGGPIPYYAKDGVERDIQPSEIGYFDYPDQNYAFTTVLGFNLDDLNEQEAKKVVLMGSSQTIFVSTANAYVTQSVYDYTPYPVLSWSDYEQILAPYETQDFKDKIAAIDESDASSWRKEALKVAEAQKLIAGLSEKQQQEAYDKLNSASKNAEAQKPIRSTNQQRTVVHKFSLGKEISYQGKGSVPGFVLNQFSMDENNGYFRIATTSDNYNYGPMGEFQQSTSENAVYVLDGKLGVVGSVTNLAPGERIYSARFMGDKLYLVTFKQIDPLFVIDLKDPAKPAVLGYLKIPGYSSYLHPFDETHVIGLGKNTEDVKEGNGNLAFPLGVKLSLFDVSDVSTPKEIATYDIGDSGSDSAALNDHKAFLFNPKTGLLVIPALEAKIDKSKYPNGTPVHVYGDFVFQGAYVFNVDLQKGFTLKGTVSHATPEELAKAGYYYYGTQVQRSAYINNVLYTVSNRFVKANDLNTLAPLGSVEIANDTVIYPPAGLPL